MITNSLCSYLAMQEGDEWAFFIFYIVIPVVLLVLHPLFCLVHCIRNNKLSSMDRIVGSLVIVFIPILGAILYQGARIYHKFRSFF